MSRDASITLPWGDGEYTFRLGWGELVKLQEACDAGPFVILDRLASMTCRLDDITATIQWALVGGMGTAPVEAAKKVNLFVKDRPPGENRLIAYAIMQAACYGAPEEEIEKKSEAPAKDNGSTNSQTESSGSEPSTASAESSGSRRKK